MKPGHAEIAGGGFAGFTAAIALASRGWSVRVHERQSSLRTEGFAISIHLNGLRVLDALGVADDVIACATRVLEQRRHRHGGKIAGVFPLKATYRVPRHELMTILEARARALGVDVRYGSEVVSADGLGRAVLACGSQVAADLIVAADGYGSNIRAGLDVLKERRLLHDGAIRILGPDPDGLADVPDARTAASVEYWSGTRRVLCGRCKGGLLYTALTCLNADPDGRAVPINVDTWSESFPYLGSLFEHLRGAVDWSSVKFVPFEVIKLHSWSVGKIALVGDAAHAMPPNLGQGGGMAMMNALALAQHLADAENLADGLRSWEEHERPLTEHTQSWALAYSSTTRWPPVLRSTLFRLIQNSRWLRSNFQRAANTVPTGWSPSATSFQPLKET